MPASISTQHVHIKVDRALLNPLFDGYKLRYSQGVRAVAAVTLEVPSSSGGKVSSVPGLPYKRVDLRAKFNHLFVDTFCEGRAFFVNDQYTIMEALMESPTSVLTIREVFQLPIPSLPIEEREYPSIQTPSLDMLIIADGAGSTYFLHLTSPPSLLAVSTDNLQDSTSPSVLLSSLHDVTGPQNYLRYLFLRVRIQETDAVKPVDPTSRVIARKMVTFYIDLVRATLSPSTPNQSLALEVLTSVRSPSFPYSGLIEQDGSNPPPPSSPHISGCKPPQTLPFISTSPTPLTNVTLKSSSLAPPSPLWTIERNLHMTFHLQKHHQGTKWTHLGDVDDDVLECVDPSEIAADTNPEEEDYEGSNASFTRFTSSGEVTHICNSGSKEYMATLPPRTFCSSFRHMRLGVVVEARRQMYVYRRTAREGDSSSEQYIGLDVVDEVEMVAAGDVVG
ncbi:hypothetical protein BC829DRAFT_398107 [Chytridium lagenaria]|nr:hypothetical protein BC829DRAFT_398107 [Chytridium lagenaria]